MSGYISDYNQTHPSNVTVAPGRVYADLDLGFNIHPVYKDIKALTDVDAVKNAVKNLILTNRGERPFQPNIGSDIYASLFEPANAFMIESIRDNIKDMLFAIEPRVNDVRVSIQNREELNQMHVTIVFNVTGVAQNQTVDFYLERLR